MLIPALHSYGQFIYYRRGYRVEISKPDRSNAFRYLWYIQNNYFHQMALVTTWVQCWCNLSHYQTQNNAIWNIISRSSCMFNDVPQCILWLLDLAISCATCTEWMNTLHLWASCTAFWPAQHSHALRGRECTALYSFSHHWHEGMQPTRPQHIVFRLTQRERERAAQLMHLHSASLVSHCLTP